MSQYSIDKKYRVGVDPQIAGNELERIRLKNNGDLKPQSVVDESKPEDAPLHGYFDWDDSTAANAYRKDQARRLIRVIRVETNIPNQAPKHVYHNVEPTESESQAYRHVKDVFNDPEMRAKVLMRAWNDLKSFHARYLELKDLAEDAALQNVFQIIEARTQEELSKMA